MSPADALRALVPALEAQPWVASLTLLLHGRVPLIKAALALALTLILTLTPRAPRHGPGRFGRSGLGLGLTLNLA